MKADLATKAIARLGAVDVREAFIPAGRGDGGEVYGLWEAAGEAGVRPRITINPSWHVVTTLVHEALHELKPEWSERAVRGRATRIVNKMKPEQVWAIYEEYRRRVDGRP